MHVGWGDESSSSYASDPGTYILAAVLADESNAADVREAMRSLLLRGQRKVHWRDESEKRRDEISCTVAALPVEGLVVVRSNKSDDKVERRRRKCLEALLWELHNCDRLIMESRGRADDMRDRELVDSLRRRHAIPKGLHTDHTAGPADPGLWAADALCGAITRDRTGDPGYLSVMKSRIKIRIMDVD